MFLHIVCIQVSHMTHITSWSNVGEECPPTFGYADLNAGGWAIARYTTSSNTIRK